MNRCLHITINEGSDAKPQRASTSFPVQAGIDPGSDYVIPPIDDPGSDYVIPPIDDPGSDYVIPPIDDPGWGFSPAPSGGAGGYNAMATVHAYTTSAGPGAPAGSGETAAPLSFLRPRDYSGFIIVRMAEGVGADSTAESLWALAEEHTPKLTGLQEVLRLPIEAGNEGEEAEPEAVGPSQEPSGVLVSRALVELQEPASGGGYASPRPVALPRPQCLNILHELEKKAATTVLPPLHSLTSYWRLDLCKHPELMEEVVARLNSLAEVDRAYRELAASDPQETVAVGKHFAADQGYLDNAPVGIGAAWIRESLNGTASSGSKVTLCDLEQGWTTGHLDLKPVVPSSPFYGANRAPDEGSSGHHGTAVLGQLAATGAGPIGVKGAATGLGQFVLASHYRSKAETILPGTNGHVAAAIIQALSGPLREGDILLLEVQRGLLPTEVDDVDFDAIRLATAHGIVVVEAAGNGGFDLDAYTDPDTGRTLRRGAPGFRDSGAILVGAARAGLPHDRAPFSNYGSRIDCFGWGETVTTCGYGDLAGTVATDFYTSAFSGTSSASPIIAGAAALVQALHKDRAGYVLEPRSMRALLSNPATGTVQGPNVPGHIGVMPDLQAIVRERLRLVPDVYMRRSVEDHDSKPDRDETISSSPDILLWTGPPEEAGERFGEGPRASVPAPGNPINATAPNQIYSGPPKASHLYVRLRNRGMGMGKARIQLFASPAATLITPERWMPVGSPINVDEIPQGDTLKVSPPVPVNFLPQQWPQVAAQWPKEIVPAYSFLAVQLPWSGAPSYAPGYEQTVVLPPGPPYFDWAEYRSFLRGPGVTWRNIHAVKVGADLTLGFLIAGTPDRTRHFDFEVIQRLPAGAEVIFQVPSALAAAKLRQRQSWLANGSEILSLPRRPRTTLSHVALAPDVYAPAAFQVKTAPGTLLRGHSLALRQLWRGEEVGRITWWFLDE